MNTNNEARKLLAAEYRRDGSNLTEVILSEPLERLNPPEQRALRAIDRALAERDAERVAVVTWLRAIDWDSESRAYAAAFADAIERGDHLEAPSHD